MGPYERGSRVSRLSGALFALSLFAAQLVWSMPTLAADPTPSPSPACGTPTSPPCRNPTTAPTPSASPKVTPKPSFDPTPRPTASSTRPPSPSPTETASPTPVPTPTPTCATNAPNLLQNPGFESVGTPTNSAGTDWTALEAATTNVLTWTRVNPGAAPPLVTSNGAASYGLLHVAPQGSRYAVLPNYLASGSQELIGTLSTATTAGATYVLSAAIATEYLALIDATFEVRLRSSATGAESAPVVQASIAHPTSWGSLTGTVTDSTTYDRIVIRYHYQPQASVGTRPGLADDVRVCQVGAVAPATASPTNVAIATTKPTPAPASAPACALDAVNLLRNPSFETVSGAPYANGEWPVYEPLLGAASGSSTTQVTDWTRTDSSIRWPVVVGPGTPYALAQMAFQGTRYALIPATGYLGGHFQGLVGTLSAATIAGATYVLNAQIATEDSTNAPTFEVRLRNSATGAESDAIVQTSSVLTGSWLLVAGTVTATGAYDRVVLRYQASNISGSGWGFVDDVRVCEAAAATAGQSGSWPVAGVVGVVLPTILLLGGLGWRSRRATRRSKVADNESPRPQDRAMATDGGESAPSKLAGGTVNDPGSSL